MTVSLATEKREMNTTGGRRMRASRAQRERQIQLDISTFRERMLRLADNLTVWLEGRDVVIIRREMVPASAAGAYTVPGIVLRHGRNWAGFTPQALYSVKGGTELKGEVHLVTDNPHRSPRTEKYMLCMSGHLLSTADWAIHSAGCTPDRGKIMTRELLLAAIAPLFDDAA